MATGTPTTTKDSTELTPNDSEETYTRAWCLLMLLDLSEAWSKLERNAERLGLEDEVTNAMVTLNDAITSTLKGTYRDPA